jgi:hypothetical protein
MIHENEIIVMLKTKDQQLKTARKSLVFRPRKVSSTEEKDSALEIVFGLWPLVSPQTSSASGGDSAA